ncbi:enolase 4 isoform X2 [Microcaecilia unicolor]|uniref:Enolase 4 n=1 Tax=Microcaecilia unicolor TaxID=1415580 RepID=A0A6P7YCQ3_9AMPH|nr:enolase 4 isoform X2 [Microcaecilia unicolor]
MGSRGTGRVCAGARQLYELKQRAAEYYRTNGVPGRIEEALNVIFFSNPDDVYGALANWFTEISKAPVISRMTGKKVLDGTGQLTVQVEILCIVQNNEKSMSSVVMSAGSGLTDSVISEAAEASERKREQSVATALEWIREALNPLLKGLVPTEQLKADQLLSDYFTEKLEEQVRKQEVKEAEFPLVPVPSKPVTPLKKRKNSPKGRRSPTSEKSIPPAEPAEPVLKGSIAIGATSLAVAKAGSVVNKSPLYLYIASLKHKQQLAQKMTMPIPLVTLLSCGKSAPGKMNLMKEVIGIPSTDLTIRESIDVFLALQKQISVLTDKVTKAGPVVKNLTSLGCIALACDRLEQPLDIIQEACNHLRLELGRNIQLAINCAAHELMDYDQEQWTNIYNTLSSKCYLIAEAATKSVSKLLESRNTNIPRSSGLVMKHIDGTTISHLIEVVQLVEGENQITIMGSMEEESSEDSLADLAVGLEARFIKLGGLIRGERATKYNRLLVIEEEMRDSEILDQRQNHTFPYIADKPQTSLKSNTTPSEETEEGHHQ